MLITTDHQRLNVPYVHQFGEALLGPDGGPAPIPAEDPRWRETGAKTYDDYVLWARNGCGTACFRMILLDQFGVAPPLVPLAQQLMNVGAYEMRANGLFGMIYAPFVGFAQRHLGFGGQVVAPLSIMRITYALSMGHYVMASVHNSIRDPRSEPPGRGGHLVLITGFDDRWGELTLHDPSGVASDRQEYARVSYRDFGRFSAGRGITVWNPGGSRQSGDLLEFKENLYRALALEQLTHRARSVLSVLSRASAQELHALNAGVGWGPMRGELGRLRMKFAGADRDFEESMRAAIARPALGETEVARDDSGRVLGR